MTSSMANPPVLPASVLQLLVAAPHRFLFFVGASNVLLAMGWWTAWLLGARWRILDLPQVAVPAGWMHSIVVQYQVLPSFMFGFLLTVFSRWMNLPALTQRHYLPVGLGLFGGQALTLTALFSGWPLLKLGALFTLVGWSIGTAILGNLVRRETGRTWHAVSCLAALIVGLLGLVLYALFLYGYDARLMHAAIKLGGIALLLPIFFSVCHRMIPFFASGVIEGYRAVRPMWTLAVFWAVVFVHTTLELLHAYAWMWLADLPMMILTSWLLWRWWPRSSTVKTSSPPQSIPPLLWILFVGFAWLPIAFALYTGQSVRFAMTGLLTLGRGPAHALFIGFFSSLLVAMVTRVSQGHSGRPLVLGWVGGFAFIVVQIVAVVRVLAEVMPDALAWQAVAAIGWMLAFAPWVMRSIWIYLTPRIDGKHG